MGDDERDSGRHRSARGVGRLCRDSESERGLGPRPSLAGRDPHLRRPSSGQHLDCNVTRAAPNSFGAGSMMKLISPTLFAVCAAICLAAPANAHGAMMLLSTPPASPVSSGGNGAPFPLAPPGIDCGPVTFPVGDTGTVRVTRGDVPCVQAAGVVNRYFSDVKTGKVNTAIIGAPSVFDGWKCWIMTIANQAVVGYAVECFECNDRGEQVPAGANIRVWPDDTATA